MRSQELFSQYFAGSVLAIMLFVLPVTVMAQTLGVEDLANGTELVLITESLSAATTVAWPDSDGEIQSITRGELNLLPDVEAALGEIVLAPPVVVVTGGSQLDELRGLFDRVFAGRPVAQLERPSTTLIEGTVDRRLGTAGSDALIRLEVPLPPPGDPRRSTVEIFWEMVPEIVEPQVPGFRARVENDVGLLEGSVNSELVDLRLDQLRLALAQAGESSRIDGARVEAARTRFEVRRIASLGEHPGAAEEVVERWLRGGVTAVQEFLFGVEGVTEASVREAAKSWLPQHPGRVALVLPPRVFNPRFAPGPQVVQLDNDLVMAVLERPGAGLAAINLRPVLLPDVDGQLSATVLARVAAELRRSGSPPGWVRVAERPPSLELATTEEGLPDLIEVLQAALERVAEDDRTVALEGADGRRRALQMMAVLLGLSEGVELSPAALLRPGNLAVGVVAPDAEAAIESAEKFNLGGPEAPVVPDSLSVQSEPRTREAAVGNTSTLVVALSLGLMTSDVSAAVVSEVVSARVASGWEGTSVEVLRPVVPGRKLALLVVTAPGPLEDLEGRMARMWKTVIAPVEEGELTDARRRVAAGVASAASGPLGRARLCAAVAVGNTLWRRPADLELEAVGLPAEDVAVVLGSLPGWGDLDTTGAGVLPVPGS